MRSILVVCGLFFAVSAYAGAAAADVNVTCIGGDCLTYGWDVYDTYKSQALTVICHNSNCINEGWSGTLTHSGGEIPQDETVCKGRDCFKYGWTVYDAVTNQVKVDVTCRLDYYGVSNCLRSGWDVRDFQNHMGQSVLCLYGNCRYSGWDIYTPGYPISSTRCKLGGCFQDGWVSY